MSKTLTAIELKLMLADAEVREANARVERIETARLLLDQMADIDPRLADKAIRKLQRHLQSASASTGAPSETGATHGRAEPSSRASEREDGVSHGGEQADAAAGPHTTVER